MTREAGRQGRRTVWQRLELEPWTASQLHFLGYGDPALTALVPCLARWQQTLEYNALIGPATWLGAVSEWAAADIDRGPLDGLLRLVDRVS